MEQVACNTISRAERLTAIARTASREAQPLPFGDASRFLKPTNHKRSLVNSMKRSLKYLIASPALRFQQSKLKDVIDCQLTIPYDLLSMGGRFSGEVSARQMMRAVPDMQKRRVLVVGCSGGDEIVEFWLRHKIRNLDGIDIYDFTDHWRRLENELTVKYDSEIRFRQATVEDMPFGDESFDIISSEAVLEHVQNIEQAISETYRVLKRGGWAWHRFGPLYFCHGGDHCISAYGQERGFDHLLLSEEEYQRAINNQEFYAITGDPDQNYWARTNQFSFALPSEYLEIFSRYFEVEHVLLTISPPALSFRRAYPEKWQQMLKCRVPEAALMIEDISILVQKS